MRPLPLQYEDLLRFSNSVPLLDYEGNDTHWETVFYDDYHQRGLPEALTHIYALLKTDGDIDVLEHLSVAQIDHCAFGNTRPFRIRIINRLNDNYDHYYVKKIDASRIYGMELEDILSPNQVSYLVDRSTIIEEHIAGVPGDMFMENYLEDTVFNQIRMAKEFVKFNERCFARLLGDMRAYNYVVDITPDIEGTQFRIRAIDFDQQSYESRKNFYLPQYFKDNNPIIFLGIKHMSSETVRQYQMEERSLIAARATLESSRLDRLLAIMVGETLSTPEKVNQLALELSKHHKNEVFLQCDTMGELVLSNIRLLLQKDFKQSIVLKER
ncbi:MAG: hypothetical protein AAF587_13585 [Bacteroidota bacterium]